MPNVGICCAIRYSWPTFCLVIYLLTLSSCFFGGNSKQEIPEPVAVQEKPAPPPKESSLPTNLDQEIQKKFHALSREKEEIYDEILSKLAALEEKHQTLRERIAVLESRYQEDANKEKQSREEIETKIEQLKVQLEQYNGLMLNIIQKISTEPKK